MKLVRIFLCCALIITPPLLGAENARMQATPSGNTYASGSEVNLLQPTAGDLLAAGGKLRIEREIRADAALAGGSIEVRAPVGQDLRLAGGTVTIAAPVGGDLVVAGGNIEVQDTAVIAGPAWIAGGNVSFRGSAGHGSRIYARSLMLAGQIKGDAYLVAQQISFAPGARIEGNLRYSSPSRLGPEIAGMVGGSVDYEPVTTEERAAVPPAYAWAGFLVTALLAFLFIGMLASRLFPVAVQAGQAAYSGSPGKSFLLGAALLFSLPPVAILCFVTVIGIPIALVLLAFYPVMLLAGYLGSVYFFASKISAAFGRSWDARWWQQAGFLAAALLILFLLAWIPFAGVLILGILLATGIGAWALSIYRRFWGNEA